MVKVSFVLQRGRGATDCLGGANDIKPETEDFS